MILYPAGWGAERVQRICGSEADAFYLANCSLGKSKTPIYLLLKILKNASPILNSDFYYSF